MTTLSIIPADAVIIHEAEIRTTSIKVAEAFGRRHADVIATINKLDCSEQFASTNFFAHVQKVTIGNGASRESKIYEMTKDGFIFLVGRFNGKLAAQIFEAYINAFNVMADQLSERHRPAETVTPSEQQTLSEVAHKKAALHQSTGKALAEIWSRVHNKFRIAKYDQLPRTQLAEAIVYISQLQLRAPLTPQETLTEDHMRFINSRLREIQDCSLFRGDSSFLTWARNRIRTDFSVNEIADIYAKDWPKVERLLDQLDADVREFVCFISRGKQAFLKEVISGGSPYIPWIMRRMGGTKTLPARPDWRKLALALNS
ncbi:Rha family transcriptional regulator [Alkalimonas sp. NCh-2]|uniref:Rha family transcriptional regulator n=1 Tax=Alkalimonas sp. NCh-2 TaxID=3144846 RepID=UPI0031F60FDF